MADQSASTLKSYANSTVGTVQSALGSVMGNSAEKASGERKKEEAENICDTAERVAKGGPVTITSAGGISMADSDRTKGSWGQTAGAAKEALGSLVGSKSLEDNGAQQKADGKVQEAQGQLRDLGNGAMDRLQGFMSGTVASMTGNEQAAEEAKVQHDNGKSLQRGVEVDVQGGKK
ncbi:unnamed protein product [Blumeria hordei]|uniref:CsbD-like domain-containing protein n=2 Tax=Blumeria hordei TaxID=2867405 RepID=A0A383UQS3_BLUHO|nr:mismatched base pair and/cruciform DNA recognition protein [Blumeria hordei DH14]SZF02661.1 unnamed protein product [Blumeria hordei]